MKKPAAGIVLVAICCLAQFAQACSPTTDTEGLPATQTAVASSVHATLTAEAQVAEVAQAPPTETPGPAVEAMSPTPPPAAQAEATPQPGQVRGRVIDHDTGQPVQGAQAILGKDVTASDADGEFAFDEVPVGPQALVATKDGYETASTSVFSVNAGELKDITLRMYPVGTFTIPEDPMATNQVEPVGAQTEEDAIRLAQLQGLTTPIEYVEPRHLTGEYLVNYKKDDNVYTARATLDHDGWVLASGELEWYIVKVCENLAAPIPEYSPVLYVSFEPAEGVPPLPPTLMPTPTQAQPPAQTARLGQIAFLSDRDHLDEEIVNGFRPMELYLMNPDGSNQHAANVDYRYVGFGNGIPINDVTWIANRVGVFQGGGSIVIDIDSGRASTFDRPHGGRIIHCKGSTHNDTLACIYSLDVSPIQSIFILNSDGRTISEGEVFTLEKGGPWKVDLSPDGSSIVFSAWMDDHGGLYTVDADGSNLREITTSVYPENVAWSPGGSEIAFDNLTDRGSDIWVVNADGTNLINLTQTQDLRELNPTWSPDGASLAYSQGYGSEGQVFVMNADGTGKTQLTSEGGNCCPAWSR